jgi:hypothetical protein
LFDKLGAWFTIINFGDNDASPFVEAASQFHLPLKVLNLDEPAVSSVYGERMMLVRPDQHIAWRGSSPTDRRSAATVLSRVLGRA